MGRPAKTLDQHRADGTFRRHRHAGLLAVAEPDAPEPFPPPPAGLSPAVLAKWQELAPILTGVARGRDVATLTELCRWLARSEQIAATLDGLSPGDKGYGPMLVASGIATDKLLALSKLFGLSPSDRGKLRIAPDGPLRAKVAARVPVAPRVFRGEEGPPTFFSSPTEDQ